MASIKHIDNGLNTSIWGNNCLPSPYSERIIMQSPSHSIFPDKVSNLIDWSTWRWNYDLISSIFWPVDIHNISQLSFRSPKIEDRLVWAFSKSSHFTVRSCYYNLLSSKIWKEPSLTSSLNDAALTGIGFWISRYRRSFAPSWGVPATRLFPHGYRWYEDMLERTPSMSFARLRLRRSCTSSSSIFFSSPFGLEIPSPSLHILWLPILQLGFVG